MWLYQKSAKKPGTAHSVRVEWRKARKALGVRGWTGIAVVLLFGVQIGALRTGHQLRAWFVHMSENCERWG